MDEVTSRHIFKLREQLDKTLDIVEKNQGAIIRLTAIVKALQDKHND